MMENKFAIVGGGIGGLTLAIALQKKGYEVIVFENAPQIKPLGAGLALAANAIKAFAEIGIQDEVIKAGKVLKHLRIKDVSGKTINETNSEEITKKFGVVNNFTIHRAELHRVLIEQLKPGTLQLNKGCVDIETADKITLRFHDGTSEQADYVIACDGVHSSIRKKLLPESYPRYAGYTCWRGVTDKLPEGIDLNETTETWGPGRRFGIAPLTGNRIYWFACINAPANDDTMKKFRKAELLEQFGNFHFPIPQILETTKDETIIWNDIIDIKPLTRFAFGKIVLMGDAAHATTPNMGQGACMAVEDAAVLTNCLEQSSSVEEAFIAFEKKRIARTTTIVTNSWRIGKLAQIENRLLMKMRDAALRLTPPSVAEKQIRFITDVTFR